MEITREVSFRYRAGSDAPSPCVPLVNDNNLVRRGKRGVKEKAQRGRERQGRGEGVRKRKIINMSQERVIVSGSASFSTPPARSDLRDSSDSIPQIVDPDEACCSSISP